MRVNLDPKPPWFSSYEENNYGELFYSFIRIYKPQKIVELGTKAGYSAYHMARGLKANGQGTLDCFDLWEKYTEYYGFGFITKSVAEHNLREYKSIINLELRDALDVDKKYQSIDILHVDLDNEGGILEKIVPNWIDKVRQLIIIEGGSFERDQLDLSLTLKKMPVAQWLNGLDQPKADKLKQIFPTSENQTGKYVVIEGDKKYSSLSIAQWLVELSRKRKDLEYFTFELFPSLTLIRKK